MKKLDTPLFNNSCGKIFNDKIVLASANKEDEIELDEIKRVKFGLTVSVKSLMWALLPSSIFVLLYLERAKLDSIMFFLLSFVAIGITVTAVIMAEKSCYLLIKLHDGINIRVRVAIDNKKDAKKFAEIVNKRISKVRREMPLKVVAKAA